MPQYQPYDILEQARKLLATERGRLGTIQNYPAYQGNNISDISELTKKANSLNSLYSNKSAPYQNKINRVVNRTNTGIDNFDINNLLNTIKNSQNNFTNNIAYNRLTKQFGNTYNPNRNNGITKNTNNLYEELLPEFNTKLNTIGQSASLLENTRNQNTLNTLASLQINKNLRRKELVDNLGLLGSQQQGINNLHNKNLRNEYERQFNEPYKKLNSLEEAINSYNGSPPQGGDNTGEIVQALRAYGINTNKPLNSWGNQSGLNTNNYHGKLNTPINSDLAESYNELNTLSPKYGDNFKDKRKTLEQTILNNQPLGKRAINNLPFNTNTSLNVLDKDAERRFNEDVKLINGKYIKLNQFGSSNHLRNIENRTNEINKSLLEQRLKYLENGISNNLSLEHEKDNSSLKELENLSKLNNLELSNKLSSIRTKNKLGSESFNNEQSELDRQYNDYLEQLKWQFPNNRITNAIRTSNVNTNFNNIGLNNLNNFNTRYVPLNNTTSSNTIGNNEIPNRILPPATIGNNQRRNKNLAEIMREYQGYTDNQLMDSLNDNKQRIQAINVPEQINQYKQLIEEKEQELRRRNRPIQTPMSIEERVRRLNHNALRGQLYTATPAGRIRLISA